MEMQILRTILWYFLAGVLKVGFYVMRFFEIVIEMNCTFSKKFWNALMNLIDFSSIYLFYVINQNYLSMFSLMCGANLLVNIIGGKS